MLPLGLRFHIRRDWSCVIKLTRGILPLAKSAIPTYETLRDCSNALTKGQALISTAFSFASH